MATLAAIVTRLERRVIDLPTAVSSESQTLILEAHREIQELHNFQCMAALASFATTSGTADLGTLNAAFKDYRAQPFWTDDDGLTRYLRVVMDEGEVRRAFSQDATLGAGRPLVVLHPHPSSVGGEIESATLRVYPVPDGLANTSDGEYTIRIPYWSYLAVPTTNDWFTDNAERYLLANATSRAFELNWDEAKALYWRQIAAEELQRAIHRDKRLQVSHINTIVPYAGVNDPKVRL